MSDFIEVKCPDCRTIVIVNRRDGKVVEVRRPILEDSSGDRFEDAVRKVRESKDAVSKKVEETRAREKSKFDRLDALFKESLEKAKEEGPASRPVRPMDLD